MPKLGRRLETTWTPAMGVLVSFVLTFAVSRAVVFAIMWGEASDLYVRVGGAHVHHFVPGIALLAILGLYQLLADPRSTSRGLLAVGYGIALGLTFDEFGLWLHLGGSYWQRASYDAVVILAALIGMVALAPGASRWARASARYRLALVVSLVVGILFILQGYRAGSRLLAEMREIVEPTLASR